MEYQEVSDMVLPYIAILCSLNSFQRVKTNKVQRKKSYFLHPAETDSLNKWETKSKIKNMNQPKGQHIYMNCNIKNIFAARSESQGFIFETCVASSSSTL